VASTDLSIERRNGGISVLRMQRPPANALTLEFARTFTAAFDEVMATRPKALVLTGTGDFFSGGLDLRVIPNYSTAEQQAFLGILNRLVGALYACPLPVVAAVNGHAIAGAFVLALTSDYRVGPQGEAKFGLTEARVGIPFPAVPAVVVRAELSPADLRYTTLTAKLFGPDEAVARGLFDELQPPASVLDRAVDVARDLADMPTEGYARIKHQFRATAIAQIERLNAEQSDPMLAGWVSDEASKASDAVLKPTR
jgi:enoyl-CoA hydratase